MRKLRVLAVADHALVRAGLRTIVDRDRDLEVVGEAADAPPQRHRPPPSWCATRGTAAG
jgi:DNA-binding NarL/FixJ family response regulator